MKGQTGFTLIELMVTVAIVGILASIAYPSYQEQVRKARRADAQVALMELSQFLARKYTSNDSYVTDLPDSKVTGEYYDFSFSDGPDATSYTLQAVPKGVQAGDTCGTMKLSSTGKKEADQSDCWRR